MNFGFEINTQMGLQKFSLDCGTSIYFVGANGGGKSRLAAAIEDQIGGKAHRISAHRALLLNPTVAKISEQEARAGLRYGYSAKGANTQHRKGYRWSSGSAVSLLNDFDYLVQALFADQNNVALVTHLAARAKNPHDAKPTNFERLKIIWEKVLPHRTLIISGDDIKVSVPGSNVSYSAGEMSDGERAAFYLIGQTLMAEAGSLIIFDEPELHVHRSILARLWDEIEAARTDCAFIVISHDLEFVASRQGQKFVIREFAPGPKWTIEGVPLDSGFDEEITGLILGSRRPILFVEGCDTSLDHAIYRACYPQWTVIPRGSCEEVIHAVVTMRANASLTRVTCSGIVDADDYSAEEQENLTEMGISVLPVSEIENLLLLPDVLISIVMTEGHTSDEAAVIVEALLDELFSQAAIQENQSSSLLRYTRRRIDRLLKKVDLKASKNFDDLRDKFDARLSEFDLYSIAAAYTKAIETSIAEKDAKKLLRWYDNKGILSIACKAKQQKKTSFEEWIIRSLRNGSAPSMQTALKNNLPDIVAV